MAADGRWNVTLNSPMGAQQLTLVLATDGTLLSGSMESPQLPATSFSDGTVDGDKVSWSVSITQPMALTLEFTGTVEGDAISGDAKLGSFGTSTFSGTREG
jgi:hypothetical protein